VLTIFLHLSLLHDTTFTTCVRLDIPHAVFLTHPGSPTRFTRDELIEPLHLKNPGLEPIRTPDNDRPALFDPWQICPRSNGCDAKANICPGSMTEPLRHYEWVFYDKLLSLAEPITEPNFTYIIQVFISQILIDHPLEDCNLAFRQIIRHCTTSSVHQTFRLRTHPPLTPSTSSGRTEKNLTRQNKNNDPL
jgi:hypothetical protein